MRVFLFFRDWMIGKNQHRHRLLRENEPKAQRQPVLTKNNGVNQHKGPNPQLLPPAFPHQTPALEHPAGPDGDHHSLDGQPGKSQPSGLCPSKSPASANKPAMSRKAGYRHLHRPLTGGL